MFKVLKSSLPLLSLGLSLALSLSAIYYEFLHEENSRKRYTNQSAMMEKEGLVGPSNHYVVDTALNQTESLELEEQLRASTGRVAKENAKLKKQLAYKVDMANLHIEEEGRKRVVEHNRLAEATRQKAAKQEDLRVIEQSRQVDMASKRAEKKERLRLVEWNSRSETATKHAAGQERLRLEEQSRQVEKANLHAEKQEHKRLEEQSRQVEKSNQRAEEKELLRIHELAVSEDQLS